MEKNREKIIDFLQSTFLFSGLSAEKIGELLGTIDFEFSSHSSNDIICSPDEHKRRIGFVYNGECAVERRSESEGVIIPLNRIAKGDGFGILNVFTNDESFPTFIKATKDCEIMFINQQTLYSLIEKNSDIALNVIKFMGNRISFLNKKISTFSPNNTRQKVANHLHYLSKSMGESFKLNCKKTSSILNIGRASLYRSIDSLVADGVINYTGGIIKILDINKLERISK